MYEYVCFSVVKIVLDLNNLSDKEKRDIKVIKDETVQGWTTAKILQDKLELKSVCKCITMLHALEAEGYVERKEDKGIISWRWCFDRDIEVLNVTSLTECYQTTVPKKIMKKLNINNGDGVAWVRYGKVVVVLSSKNLAKKLSELELFY